MRVTETVLLPASADDAWRRLIDWETQPTWIVDAESVRIMTTQREGLGVYIEVRTRLLGLPAFTDELEVIVWDPPRRLRMAHRGALRGYGEWTLEPAAEGVRFAWTEDVSLAIPLVGELAAPLYAPIMRRLMHRSMMTLSRLLTR